MSTDKLILNFHGRVIDHLGYQMYHSPVAVISEMVSNSWDADAEQVEIILPEQLNGESEIVISDNGNGMTFIECQERFLNVGYDRRQGNPSAKSQLKKRDVLGRKGIGKFAGFGIAEKIEVVTVSKETGEKTSFILDLAKLRGDKYMGGEKEIEVSEYLEANHERKGQHGTIIKLHPLQLKRNISESSFLRSMGRRFLLHKRANDFAIRVNDKDLDEDKIDDSVEFSFPRDYADTEKPEGLALEGQWGIEKIDENNSVRWNLVFYKEPISEDELRGVAIFAKGKLAQVPFFFNILGGVRGQQGLEYLSGRIEADFIDDFEEDIIATERQRINWELDESQSLEVWGQKKIKSLLNIWVERRSANRIATLTSKISPFNNRLEKLPKFDRKIVETTLTKLAGIPRLSYENFEGLSTSILTAWEGGRLKDLIHTMSEKEYDNEGDFLDILLEANVLTALHTAEAVRVKIETIKGLEERIAKRDLENEIRDFVAESPWLLSPKWETFAKERSVENVIKQAADECKLDTTEAWNKRIDLVLSSGDQLLIVEFMRPAITIDQDHLSRFEYYVDAVRTRLQSNTAGRIRQVAGGYLIADKLDKNPTNIRKIQKLERDHLYAMDWNTLLRDAESQWKDFLDILATRAPEDGRFKSLLDN